jgi:hypothetical protein
VLFRSIKQTHFLDFIYVENPSSIIIENQKDPEWIYINYDLNGKMQLNMNAGEIKQAINESEFLNNWEDYFSFGFIRHPLDRCLAIINAEQHHVIDITILQKSWFYQGNINLVNFIGKYENLGDDFNEALKTIGLKSIRIADKRPETDWQQFFKGYNYDELAVFNDDMKLGNYSGYSYGRKSQVIASNALSV